RGGGTPSRQGRPELLTDTIIRGPHGQTALKPRRTNSSTVTALISGYRELSCEADQVSQVIALQAFFPTLVRGRDEAPSLSACCQLPEVVDRSCRDRWRRPPRTAPRRKWPCGPVAGCRHPSSEGCPFPSRAQGIAGREPRRGTRRRR